MHKPDPRQRDHDECRDAVIEYGSRRIHDSVTSLLQVSDASLLLWQAQRSDNPLEVVRSVLLDFDPTAFFSMANRDMRGQVLLQAIL